ncbi:hypothetical protein QN355_06290 [Cryobacterium sp. 10S3]|uniref:hypothetical protein n=1 Tax=Cryobacterium sp. 10S3 TaxID=3048582 RepID=UPI002AC9DA0C|nr:hypothetical protein [Cryobacterium sp. 10S3]MEB0286157.1 hypothetical protein [Cryobacterium sp. 10S3]WPX12215.1 hypothetical protein RHM57_11030 [Cryobacterium sp. 10S3]
MLDIASPILTPPHAAAIPTAAFPANFENPSIVFSAFELSARRLNMKSLAFGMSPRFHFSVCLLARRYLRVARQRERQPDAVFQLAHVERGNARPELGVADR